MGLLPETVLDTFPQQETLAVDQTQPLTYAQFMGFCEDTRFQPAWRTEADKAVEYYDGNQLDRKTLEALDRKGMGPLITNIIAPIVNVVLGMEAKTRSDVRVGADDDQWQDVAEAFSVKLMEIERQAHTNRAVADAYSGQIKAGLGWVEVSRNSNPFEYPYRTQFCHRRELFWDWRDLTPDLKHARYEIRKRWYDVDQAKAFFPRYADVLDAAMGDAFRFYLQRVHTGLTLANDFDQERGLSFEDFEDWRSLSRRRVCLYEVWYRVIYRGWVLKLPDGTAVELDMKNNTHVAIVANGAVKPIMATYTKMRMSIWAGPVRMMDVPSKRNYTPYVPFWGYREDRTGVPYGLIRAMVSPQDEVNVRRQKMMWLLGAKRVVMDEDALAQEANTIDTMLDEIARPDAVVVLNKNRVNKESAFLVDHNLGMAQQQFEIMKDAEDAAQRVVGVFNSMLGRDAKVESGVAINSLVEQGISALAEINDNYRFARSEVFSRTLDLLRDDLMGQQVSVITGEGQTRRRIFLNQRAIHEPSGLPMIKNSTAAAKVKVALEDVPSSPTYRQQQLTMLTEVMKGLPPNLQAAIAPFYMEATDLANRKNLADAMRKVLGQQVTPTTPEEAQQMQAQKAAAEQAHQLQVAQVMGAINERNARATKLKAEAQKIISDLEQAGMAPDDAKNAAQAIIDKAQGRIDQLTTQLVSERATNKLHMAAIRAEHAQHTAAAKSGAPQQPVPQPQPSAGEEQVQEMFQQLKTELDSIMNTVTEELALLRRDVSAKTQSQIENPPLPAPGKPDQAQPI